MRIKESKEKSHLFLNHKLFAEDITRLIGQIRGHSTPKASPSNKHKLQIKICNVYWALITPKPFQEKGDFKMGKQIKTAEVKKARKYKA